MKSMKTGLIEYPSTDDADKVKTPSVKITTEPQELCDDNQTLIYDMVLRSAKVQAEEQWLEKGKPWLANI
ncbi:hypothetical protein C0995_011376 [Termitomyces sp. Mi166|nr:hypothetical protein C0995_011376 [Termitomyces sp. Mi166\